MIIPPADTDELTTQEILAKTCWGENRGGGGKGMTSVANVVMNRVNSGITWWGNDIRSVCLHPYQFSCWLPSDPNRAKLLAVTDSNQAYQEAMSIASRAICGSLADLTDGATSYFAKSMSKPPKWSEGLKPVAEIEDQLFYLV